MCPAPLSRFCTLLLLAGTAQATQPEFQMRNLGTAAAIRIDGEIDAAWDAVPALDEFVEYRPKAGVPATVRTEVRFARDATYVYVLARMFDPDISRLRTGLARRDNFSNEQDWISIAIDPIGSRKVSQLFYFNADGVVWDGLTNEDTGSSTPAADFEVDIATRVLADSWIVELRIPFEELRYASRTPDNWHVLVRRNYPRDERRAMSAPAIPATAPCFMCLAAPLHPPGELPPMRTLALVPTIIALANDDHERDLEPSLDAKWRVSPATVFDAAINPDFSQVELDTPQLSSNQQFAVSIPEKRPFFLEGIDILDSPLTAIYTRTITDPSWGARGTHRGGWDGALLTARDVGGGYVILPGAYRARFLPQSFDSQATIGRARLPVGDFTLGGVFTDRRAGDGYNSVVGPDVAWRLSQETRVSAQFLASRTHAVDEFPGTPGTVNGNAAMLDFFHESPAWRAELELARLDDGFRADNGYIPQAGIESYEGELRRKFTNVSRLTELAPYVNFDTRTALDGERVSSAPRLGAQAIFPNNLTLVAEWRPREQVRTRAGGDLHEYAQGSLSLTAYPGTKIPVATLAVIAGDAVDFAADRVGRGETVSASILWRPLNRLEIQPSLDYTRVRTDAGDTEESIAQLLATLHLTARERFRLIVQQIEFAEESQLVGSLLFTHERSLTRRVYAGVSFAHSDSAGVTTRDDVELFLKLQWGFSSARGFSLSP